MKRKAGLFIFCAIIITCIGFLLAYQSEKYPAYDGYGAAFIAMFLIGLVGFVAWRTYSKKWPVYLWSACYVALIAGLIIIRVINKFFVSFSNDVAIFYYRVRDFFITPMPFLILYIIVWQTSRYAQNAQNNNPAG